MAVDAALALTQAKVHDDAADNDDLSASSSDEGLTRESDSELSVGDSQDHPAMVWDTPLEKARGLSGLQTTLSLVTSIIGAGIMALPMLPRTCGINAVIAFSIFGAWATQESGSAFYKAWAAWNRTKRPEDAIVTFEDFAAAGLGKGGATLVRFSMLISLVGSMAGYVVLIVQQLRGISGLEWKTSTWILIVGPVLWFLCMMRDISAVAKLVPLAVLAAIGSCILISLAAWDDQDHWESWPEKDIARMHSYGPEHGILPLGTAFGCITGAFSVMANIPPIISEMKRPKHFPKALNSAMMICSALYLAVIIIGYWGYGNFIQPNILVSMTKFPVNATEAFDMPVTSWSGTSGPYLANMLSYCVICNLLLSYPVMMMSVFASVQGLSCAKTNMQPGQPRNYVMRTGFVLATCLIAAVVPNFGVIFEFFCSVCGPFLGFFVPIVAGERIRKQLGAKGSSPMRLFLHVLIMVSGVFCIVVGFVGSCKDLKEVIQSGE